MEFHSQMRRSWTMNFARRRKLRRIPHVRRLQLLLHYPIIRLVAWPAIQIGDIHVEAKEAKEKVTSELHVKIRAEVDYHNLEVHTFEMEAEIASLKETLWTAVEEKEEAYITNGILESKVDSLSNNLNAADLEIKFLKEEITKMEQKLGESVSHSENLKVSHDLLTKEREEMGMQLADALLEMEVEKSTWLSKEKALMESDERLKLSNEEITRLSKDLLEVRHELDSCREQCRVMRERLILLEENAERVKDCSSGIFAENAQLRNELKQCKVDNDKYQNALSKLEVLSSEYHHARAEVQKLQEELKFIIQERDKLSLQLKKTDKGSDLLNDYQESIISNKDRTKLRMQLRSTQAKLDAFRGRYKEIVEEKRLMNKKFEEASNNYKDKLRWYGNQLLHAQKQLVNRS